MGVPAGDRSASVVDGAGGVNGGRPRLWGRSLGSGGGELVLVELEHVVGGGQQAPFRSDG